jgi:hypothetical protein
MISRFAYSGNRYGIKTCADHTSKMDLFSHAVAGHFNHQTSRKDLFSNSTAIFSDTQNKTNLFFRPFLDPTQAIKSVGWTKFSQATTECSFETFKQQTLKQIAQAIHAR